MNANTRIAQPDRKSVTTPLILKGVIRIGFSILILGAILFITSGRLDWVMAWVLLGVLLACISVNMLVLITTNPELVEERIQGKRGSKKWDQVLASIMGGCWFVALLVAGLDHRFGWSPQIALWLQILALVILVLGDLLFLWAMAVNKFFSKLVRIQKERSHHVVTAGPYQYVRHPGYVGLILMSCAPPVILSSLWAFIPAGLAICLMLVRTALEDRTLQEELDGYKDYTKRVSYRLLPGIW